MTGRLSFILTGFSLVVFIRCNNVLVKHMVFDGLDKRTLAFCEFGEFNQIISDKML